MPKVKLLCCWLVLMLAVLVNANKERTVKNVAFNKNINTFKDWTCGKPQPRVVHINDLERYAAPNVIYIPSAVVIHECGKSTGCCQKAGTICQSVEVEEEEVSFAVQALHIGADPAASKKNKKNKRKTKIVLRNSTRCHCVSQNDERARKASRPAGDTVTLLNFN